MSITEKDIKRLTPEHRVVWKEREAPREVELGLWEDRAGHLRTDAGQLVRWADGEMFALALPIVRIIEPAFVPRRGLVIGHPDNVLRRLVCAGDDEWLGWAPEIDDGSRWFDDIEAHALIEGYGWKVVDDLTKEKSDD